MIRIVLKNGAGEEYVYFTRPLITNIGTFLAIKNRETGDELLINKDEISRVRITSTEPSGTKLERLLKEVVEVVRETEEQRDIEEIDC